MKRVKVVFTDGTDTEGMLTKKEIDRLFNCLGQAELKEEDRFIVLNHLAFRANLIHSIYVDEVK